MQVELDPEDILTRARVCLCVQVELDPEGTLTRARVCLRVQVELDPEGALTHACVCLRVQVELDPEGTLTRARVCLCVQVELDPEDEDLLRKREDLMDTIIEEEEQLITAHRLQIEENMDMVRKEMNLLTEVDQPGSAIDQYVEKLDAILRQKSDGIAELKVRSSTRARRM